jgi:dienelactone hydrolase
MLSQRTPLTMLALLLVPLATLTAHGDEQPGFVEDCFISGGKTVRVDRFEPAANGKHPAVVFLHGVDGIHPGSAGTYQAVARSLADRGFVVFIVHYFDRTDTQPADSAALLKGFRAHLLQEKDCEKQQHLTKLFAAWKETVKDALTHARQQEKVDGERIALVGLSLGGFLATAVASDREQKVAAVVTLFGGIPRESAKTLRRFPPALILAGDKDQVVPHQESLALRDLLREMKIPELAHVYPDVDHCFKNSLTAALDAQGRITVFLQARLVREGKKPPVLEPVALR